MTFQELGLKAPILKALTEQGYERPSPIQEKAIPPALAGRDVLGCAQTGTGKTCAFAAPILQRLNADVVVGPRYIRSLILTPTRELALQIQENILAYSRHLHLRSAVIFGGVGQNPQVEQLKKGVDILVATQAGWAICTTRNLWTCPGWRFLCWMRPTGCWTWALSTMSAGFLAGCLRRSRPSFSPPPCPRRSRGWWTPCW